MVNTLQSDIHADFKGTNTFVFSTKELSLQARWMETASFAGT